MRQFKYTLKKNNLFNKTDLTEAKILAIDTIDIGNLSLREVYNGKRGIYPALENKFKYTPVWLYRVSRNLVKLGIQVNYKSMLC